MAYSSTILSSHGGEADPAPMGNRFATGREKDHHATQIHKKRKALQAARRAFSAEGSMRPFRLLKQDVRNIARRYTSDWTLFNQLVLASAVYVFFTNLLPGITFASDLYQLTGKNWGSIEVVFSTGLCGVIFSL